MCASAEEKALVFGEAVRAHPRRVANASAVIARGLAVEAREVSTHGRLALDFILLTIVECGVAGAIALML